MLLWNPFTTTPPTCQWVVTPRWIVYHVPKRHAFHPSARTGAQRAAIYDEFMKVRPWSPDEEPFEIPPRDAPPIPGLPVHQGTMRAHRGDTHDSLGQRPGRPSEQDPDKATFQPVKCQRLFIAGAHSCYFEVLPPRISDEPNQQRRLDLV
ncbi:hypothetical protein N7513_003285 [Penicillium frequentans]|nr:hypothetical protein N7513_003285 [Penicillium glabrum]